MTDLPDSWEWASLGEIAEVRGGIQKQSKRRPVKNKHSFLRVANVLRGALDLDDVHEVELFDGELERYRLQRGDLLVVEGNGSPDQIGRAAVWDGSIENCVHQNHLIRVRPSGAILPSYLEYAWNSPSVSQNLRQLAGSTSGLYTLSTSKLKSVRVPVPPLAEQRRIVAALEEWLSRLNVASVSLQAVKPRAAALRDACLDKAVRGALLHQNVELDPTGCNMQIEAAPNAKIDYSILPPLPKDWKWRLAKDVCQLIAAGSTPPADLMYPGDGEIPFLKVYNLTKVGVINFDVRPTFIDRSTHDGLLRRSRVKPKDVLTNIVGPPLGKSSIVPGTYPDWNINQAIVAFRAGPEISPEWLAIVLRSPLILGLLEGTARATAGQFNIAVSTCRELPIPVPPPQQQQQVSATVDALLSAISAADTTSTQVTMAATLRASILSRAFAGRLVPQDPSDEPASELLGRIRAERAAVPPRQRAGHARRTQKDKPAPLTRVIGHDYQQGELPL